MRGVVAAPHRLAAEAGAEVLREGGTAVDAAVAADAVLCVVYPHMTSVGGDLMALVWPGGASSPIGLIGAGGAGSLATIEAVRERGYDAMPERGPLTVTVPATPEAWGRLVERFGRLGLEPLMEAAVRLARDGYPVTERLSGFLHEHASWLMADPDTARLWPPLKPGMTLRNPELAATLEEIGRDGYAPFYAGRVGGAIAATLEQRGGLLTAGDLLRPRCRWVEPVAFTFRDLTVYELPPPTQGLAAAGMLRRLERCSEEQLRPGVPFARTLVRVRDQVYPLRDRYLSDPDFVAVPWEPFLDPDQGGGVAPPVPDGDTIYLCAADAEGTVVSLIQSVAGTFGSGIVARGTGVLLQNRGTYFSLDPSHVNRLEPHKRTMHTLIPALAGRDGRCLAAFGSMGADGQPQIQAQLLLNLAIRGLDPARAVAAPRLRVPPGGQGLWVEADYPEAGAVARAVPGSQLLPACSWQMGHAQALVLDGHGGWKAGADPRADGSVAGA
jgi:gamma-glutamyltranspeptidase